MPNTVAVLLLFAIVFVGGLLWATRGHCAEPMDKAMLPDIRGRRLRPSVSHMTVVLELEVIQL